MAGDTIKFRRQWVDLGAFDAALRGRGPHETTSKSIEFILPRGCKIMVDAGLRLLSLANQLAAAGRSVYLNFEDREQAFGYLNRIGFFDYLDPAVEVIPGRPRVSGAKVYWGQSSSLVEIAAVSPNESDRTLPSRLADALQASITPEARAKSLAKAAFTVFAELSQNIHLHSDTPIDGYAALQLYKQGGRVKVAVSDSGKGILATLRPSLASWNPRAATLNDTNLIVEVFRAGLSRHGQGRGCGLQISAKHALRFRAELDVRLPRCRVHLEPSPDGYRPHMAHCREGLPLLWGTHVCFDFRVDI